MFTSNQPDAVRLNVVTRQKQSVWLITPDLDCVLRWGSKQKQNSMFRFRREKKDYSNQFKFPAFQKQSERHGLSKRKIRIFFETFWSQNKMMRAKKMKCHHKRILMGFLPWTVVTFPRLGQWRWHRGRLLAFASWEPWFNSRRPINIHLQLFVAS